MSGLLTCFLVEFRICIWTGSNWFQRLERSPWIWVGEIKRWNPGYPALSPNLAVAAVACGQFQFAV